MLDFLKSALQCNNVIIHTHAQAIKDLALSRGFLCLPRASTYRSPALGRHKNPLERAQILNSPRWGVDYLSNPRGRQNLRSVVVHFQFQ